MERRVKVEPLVVTRRQEFGGVALNAVLMLVTSGALFYGGLYAFGSTDPTPWNKPATVKGQTVLFTYTGSECQDGEASTSSRT